MSFLNGAGASGTGLAAVKQIGAKLFGGGNVAANGLGHLIGTDPSHVSQIAGQIGRGMNGIAAAGGAAPGYAAPEAPAAPDNHMQLLDPAVIQSIIRQMGGQHQ